MAIPSRVYGAGTFFVTSVAWERRCIFQAEADARSLVEKRNAYRENYLLHAYAVMPDHVHLRMPPQGLKPRPAADVSGTASAVPFPFSKSDPADTEAQLFRRSKSGPAGTEDLPFQECTKHGGSKEHHALGEAAMEPHGKGAATSEIGRALDLNDDAAWLEHGGA